jgi:hypothetical protein
MTSRLLEDLLLKKKATSVIVPMGGWEMAVTRENLQEAVKLLGGRNEEGANVLGDNPVVRDQD